MNAICGISDFAPLGLHFVYYYFTGRCPALMIQLFQSINI